MAELTITQHAVERYQERVENVPDEEARTRIGCGMDCAARPYLPKPPASSRCWRTGNCQSATCPDRAAYAMRLRHASGQRT